MKRILLVLDDYNELLFIETILKKVGFDATGTQKIKGLNDVVMSVNPMVIIISETVKGQRGIDLLTDLKDARPQMMALMLLNPGSKPPMSRAAQAFISRPIEPLQMLKIVADWMGMKEEKVLEKVEKMGLFKNDKAAENLQVVKGGKAEGNGASHVGGDNHIEAIVPSEGLKFFKQTSEQTENRSKRFRDAILNLPDPKNLKFEKKNVIQEVKDFRQREQDPEIVNIDTQRKAFVDALYETRKKSR